MRNRGVQIEKSYQVATEIVRPNRAVANGIQGWVSEEYFYKFGLADPRVIKILGQAFQFNRRGLFQRQSDFVDIMVPYVKDFLKVVGAEEPLVYKGVSYSPYVTNLGENLNLLDFFAYLKKSGFRGIILNASPYAVVNYEGRSPALVYSSKSAKEAAENLLSWFLSSSEVMESSRIRGKYLEAIASSLFPQKTRPLVINADEMWESMRYRESLQEAIECCCAPVNEGGKLIVKKYANYNRYDSDYQRWYSILVLAEVFYLRDVFGVNLKLGPTTESNFDSLIKKSMNNRGSQFGFIWYDRSVEKEVPPNMRIAFSDSDKEIKRKLKNKTVAGWTNSLVSPFLQSPFVSIKKKVREIMEVVNPLAERISVPRLNEGGFFLEFPPGECD